MNEEKALDWRNCSVTIALLAINIIGYIVCTQTGETFYDAGSMNPESILFDHEYYRLLSAIFLHADTGHIVSNMIFLAGIGQMVERAIGHIPFLILYVAAGLSGSLISMAHSIAGGVLYRSVGASGAIFGLIGALFVLVLVNGGQYGEVSIGRLIFAIVYMIYSGAVVHQVDNAAHIGGLIGGVTVMAAMNVIKVFGREGGSNG